MNDKLICGMKFIKYIFLSGLILLSVIIPVVAQEDLNDCELLAKNYQREHYGSLVFIQPLKDNGAFDLGAYNGHWLNKAWNKEHGVYYYDVQDDLYFHTKAEVLDWYEWMTGKKAIVYNIQEGEVPPFGIIDIGLLYLNYNTSRC